MITTNYGKLCIGNRFYSGGGEGFDDVDWGRLNREAADRIDADTQKIVEWFESPASRVELTPIARIREPRTRIKRIDHTDFVEGTRLLNTPKIVVEEEPREEVNGGLTTPNGSIYREITIPYWIERVFRRDKTEREKLGEDAFGEAEDKARKEQEFIPSNPNVSRRPNTQVEHDQENPYGVRVRVEINFAGDLTAQEINALTSGSDAPSDSSDLTEVRTILRSNYGDF